MNNTLIETAMSIINDQDNRVNKMKSDYKIILINLLHVIIKVINKYY